ncbi:uncharacterized protein LOC144434153 [Glandiceps talaboti]
METANGQTRSGTGKKSHRRRTSTPKVAAMRAKRKQSKDSSGLMSTPKIKKEYDVDTTAMPITPKHVTPKIKKEYDPDGTHSKRFTGSQKKMKMGERRHQFGCHYCWVSTRDKVTLDIHMQLHTQSSESPKRYGEFRFRCERCPSYSVYRRSHVERHLRHHQLLESRKWGTMEVAPGKETFFCNFCDYATVKIFNLVKHVPCCKGYKAGNKAVYRAKEAGYEQSELGTKVKPKKTSHGSTMSKKLVEKSKRLMVKKVNKKKMEISAPSTKSGDNPGVIVSTTKISHLMEKYRVNGNVKRHRCRICGYESNNVGHVVRHMVVHRKDKKKWPYKCTKCSASFSIMGNLAQHLKVHSLEIGSFFCEKCNKVYQSRVGLYKHMRKYHENGGQKGDKVKSNTSKTKKSKTKKIKIKEEPVPEIEIKQEPYDPFSSPVQDVPLNLQTHRCPQCDYIAQTKILLKIHVRDMHSPQKSFRCAQCSYATTEKSNLVRHVKMLHNNGEESFQCSLCPFSTTTKNRLAIHMTQHTGTSSYMCEECLYVTNSSEDLAEHAQIHVREKAFKCPACPFTTSQKHDFDVHLDAHGAKEMYHCHYCDYAVSTARSLDIHLRLHIKMEPFCCDQCDYNTNNKAAYEWHVRCHTDSTLFKCDYCESRFHKKGSLLLHMKMHTANRYQENGDDFSPNTSFTSVDSLLIDTTGEMRLCSYCDFQTTQPLVLAQHLRTEHAEAMPFKCGLCGFSASKLANYYQHMRRYHVDHSAQYKCSECDYAGIQKSDLVVHMRKHSGQKPFKCELCPYETTRKSLLTQHKRQHTGEKPYKCTLCNFSTATYNNLMRHKRCHSGERPYHCDQCEFTSGQRSHLMRHIRVHTGDKPYMCNKCGFQTAYASEMKRHEAQHMTVKSHKCSFCSYSSNKKYAVKRHMTKCHRDDLATSTNMEEETSQEIQPVDDSVHELPLADNEMTSPVVEQQHPILDYTGGEQEPQHICQFCDRRFNTEDDWNKHVKRHFMQWPQAQNPAELMASVQASAGQEQVDNIQMIVM